MLNPQKSERKMTKTSGKKNISNLSDNILNKIDSQATLPRNPKLIRTKEKPMEQLTPSMYMKLQSMDTNQKLVRTHQMHLPQITELLDMTDTTHQKVSFVDVDEAIFQPFPSEINFQSFEPCNVYEVPLHLRNNDKVPRLVKVTQDDSPYFKIISPNDVSQKVAPGMTSIFKIQFTPEEKKDYQHELICLSEREKFVVPIKAIGARAILDFPDQVNFGVCPVKHFIPKVLFIRNIGNRESQCTMTVEEPFKISVKSNTLPVGNGMQVTLEFKPKKVGDYYGDLVIEYNTGEIVYVSLYGASLDANLRLDKSSIRIDNTYILLANQRTVTIHNRSSFLATFKWSSYATQSEEDAQKKRFYTEINEEEDEEHERVLVRSIEDPTLKDRLSILTRTFKNRKRSVKEDPLLFSDDAFQIFPIEGEIWPNSSAEVTVVFKPTEVKAYHRTIFCDVTGRESRLPLKIRGEGIGPKLAFSFDSIDIGKIFASSTHTYEVVLINKGDIDAKFRLEVDSTSCPRFYDFRFDPDKGVVHPGEHQAAEITFCSETLGPFIQEFHFAVNGNHEWLKLTISGNVIGPTFHFDIPRLDFGDVAYGFNHTKICSLFNTSLVPMAFTMRISEDGAGPPSACDLSDLGDNMLGVDFPHKDNAPREFDIKPAQGTIRSQSEMDIYVTLCSNTIKKYNYSLVVDVKGVGKELLSLPVFANCIVPSIQVLTPVLDFKRCFINYSYQMKARLLNDTNLCAKYELLPQGRDEFGAIVYGSPVPKGLIEPHATIEVPILFQVHELGEHEVSALFCIFGTHDQCLPCQLSCIGEGPVVHITPSSMNWGKTPVLISKSKTVKLSNESLIAANYTAHMMRPDSVWRLEPNQGTLPPESVTLITVTATLDDCIKFQDKLTITVMKGSTVTIPVQGHGFGTTIVVDPPISPSIHLGPHFAQSKLIKKFKLTNRGRRHQSLAWTTDGFMKRMARRELGSVNSKDMKYRLLPTAPSPPEPVFKLHPARIALGPGQTAWMTVEGSSYMPRKVSETLLCHAIIGKAQGKEQIIKASVRADFISPLLKISKKNIRFRVDKHPDDSSSLTPQTRTFSVKNMSSLPLSCKLNVGFPFQLIGFDGNPQSRMDVTLFVDQEMQMEVAFDPAFKDNFVSRIAEGEVSITYVEHPHSDSLALRGEVNFPNLDFSTKEIDFGCILNDTEATRFIYMTNSSPLPISYRWSFLVFDGDECIRYTGQVMDPESKPLPPDKPVVSVSDLDASVEDSHYMSTIPEESSAAASFPNTKLYQEEVKEKFTSLKETTKEIGTFENMTVEECEDHLDKEEAENIALCVDWPKNDMSQEDASAVERALVIERFCASSRLSSKHQPSHPIHTRLNELPLLPWLESGTHHLPQGVEEVFDILPLYGILEPGETQCVTFTYYGHADVSCNARAICEVRGGPKYEVELFGEASLIEYDFDKSLVDYGKQMFDQIAVGEIKLENTGRVGFNFVGISGLSDDDSVPGIPMLYPRSGYVAPFSDIVLKVNYRPGIPEKFHKSFEIQIAHFEATTINVVGEGVFPRLSLDLPISTQHGGSYTALLKEARENLENETTKFDRSTCSTPEGEKSYDGIPSLDVESFPSEHDVRMEVERLILKDFASENRHIFTAVGSVPDPSCGLKPKKKKFPRIRLTDYVLDFGYVILGNVRSHIVIATNTSHFPVSFSADRSSLCHTGFYVELNKVKQLPGCPDHETVDFKVTFDPRGANRGVGPVEAMMPINILSGPQLCIHMLAHVAVPDMKVSADSVDFEVVQCGQCKVVTIQLHNEETVRCEWTSIGSESSRSLYDKHLPMHLRRKARRESKLRPNHFEMMPAQGFLAPGQRMNIQIKFMPTETKHYTHRMCIQIAQSTNRMSIVCRGEGQDSKLDFEPNLVEFASILPHGVGDEMDVTVRNPTPFTAEFYSLNFDKQYLLEEKILRMMKGYDELGNLLLPPRLPGEDLPLELIQFYQDQEEKFQAMKQDKSKLDGNDLTEVDETEPDDMLANDMKSDEPSTVNENVLQNESMSHSSGKKKSESDELAKSEEIGVENTVGVGDLEITPVSEAIARHLGIDLTPEGRLARNRRGVAIIVHGAPGSGKTNTSVLLAKTYGAARLTVDDVVLEAISNGNTQNGLKARELCIQAARAFREEEPEAVTLVGISSEAVPPHAGPSVVGTTETKFGGGTSVISTKKTSLPSKHGQSTVGSKCGAPPTISEVTGSQVPSMGIDGSVCRRLSPTVSANEDQGLISCPLPEELLVEILAERLQLNDCHQGVIFDGLDTMFNTSYQSTLVSLLKAINNRKYIYFVSQKLDYSTVRARQHAMEEKNAQCILEQEQMRNSKLEEMDEDEYDALSEEEKDEIERKILERRRLRIKREAEERQERERIERERMALMEEKRLEEESMKKKGKKGKKEDAGKRSISGKQDTSSTGTAAGSRDRSQLKTIMSVGVVAQSSSHEGLDKVRPESRTTDRPDSEDAKRHKKKHRHMADDARDKILEEVQGGFSDTDLYRQQLFRAFDKSFKEISFILQYWDRSKLIVTKCSSQEGAVVQTASTEEGINNLAREKAGQSLKKGSKKEREKERLERLERERLEKEKAVKIEKEKADREKQEGFESFEDQERSSDGIGVAHLQLDANDRDNPCHKHILALNRLPPVHEVLNGLGLGPKGPPIPPPALFSVIPYPVKRKSPSTDPSGHFEFIATSLDDPNAAIEESMLKELESHQEETVITDFPRPDSKREEHLSSQGKDKKKKDQKYDGSKSSMRRSSPRKNRRSSVEGMKSPPPPLTQSMEIEQLNTLTEPSTEFKPLKLGSFRWIVPAYSEVTIRIQFNSIDLGQFDQTLSFELTGTRRRYQLFCRGACVFPTISREPMIVFPHRKKIKKAADDLVSKKYLLEEEFFEFGPLLCGKTRERYKDGKYPENMEKINIVNTSPLLANINFCFQHDSNATTFLLDPPNMILEPAESKLLWIWAYPKTAGRFMDTIVCCVRENPEPICFNVACHGVRPELEIDRKHLHFDKILLHRKDSRSLYLRNSTMLPVAWHVAGMENLGDDFSLNQESGIIEPRCEFALQLNFRATKGSNIKKAIRLEVLDVGNIMGLVQTENIQVTAEAYDVAIDMSFPKGADGGLDFGNLRVHDETKQTCSLKNKGKYEICFSFQFDRTPPGCPPADTIFSVLPPKGTLIPNDRPTQIQVIFRCQSEVTIRDLPLLKCQVIEPTIAEGKEVIACIPVKISVRSVFSKYAISPNTDINFGPMLLNSKKTRTFTIENKGEFDFKYVITKMIREAPAMRPRPMMAGGKRGKAKDAWPSSRSVVKVGRATFTRQEAGSNQTRVPVGSFTVYPGFGTILPGAIQNVNVDCVAESVEINEEFLSIDITDRDPDDNPVGIPYRIISEGCMPNINTIDVTSVFEEHRICKNLNVYLQNKKALEGTGVYGEEDNRFLFCNVVIGKKASARFKISNTNKIAVDVAISVKAISNKVSARIHDIFDVDISKSQIPPHGFIFATVTFNPPAMHTYLCNFEASVDGLPPTLRQRSLCFEICGEGNLPRVTVSRPMLRNKHGEPVLLFQRQLVNRIEAMSLVLINEGTFPSKVNLVLEQHAEPESSSDLNVVEAKPSSTGCEKVFTLITHSNVTTYVPVTLPGLTDHFPYTASVMLEPDETAEFDVIFKPTRAQVFTGQIVLKTVNNQFEEHKVQLYGEGFKDDITFDNLHVDGDTAALIGDDGVLDMDALSQHLTADSSGTSLGNLGATITFGDCDVGVPKTRTFAITNHSSSDSLRFKFDEHPCLKFVPATGHLHPGTSKELTVTFKNDQPSDVKKTIVKCSASKILFAFPMDQIADWDDRMQTVKWTDVVDPARPTGRCIKKKVVETEPEPDHTVAEESTRQLELIILAKVDYAKCSCDTSAISFKDTLMFQSRVYEFTMKNEGTVDLHHDWQLFVEGLCSCPDTDVRPTTAAYSARGAGIESSLRSIIDDDSIMPFSVSPAEGKIEPGQKLRLSVRFSPTEVAEFHTRLMCSIENLDPGQEGPSIQLKGRSLMPYCHFELDDSDYISGSRRNPDHPGPGGAPPGATIDPNTKVVEFNPIGVDTNDEKKFWIMNPTSNSYSFRWVCLDVPDARMPSKFACKVKEGELLSGKKLEMSFCFKPLNLEVFESFWKFIIPENNISIPFLFVGHANEPRVALSSSHVNFNSILVGRTATNTVHLINNEPVSFMYEVLDYSCYSEARACKLDVSPLKGNLPANARLPLQISYTAKVAEDSNFNVIVKVNRKTKPITLNVKGSGHKLNVQLLCENSQGFKIELSPAGLNAINLGEIEVHEKAMRQLHLVNPGQHNFAFHWKISSQEPNLAKKPTMTVAPGSGIVTSGSRKRCLLTFQATKVGLIPMHELSLKITEGPTYLCHVTAIGVNPGVEFSMKKCDFGPCFVYKAGMPLNTATVHITNKDRKEISVECLYQNTSHFEVSFYATLLAPGKSAFAHLTFYPRDAITYRETVTFLVNGLSKHDVEVDGEGTDLRVEVVNGKQKQLNFGALRVGQKVKHIVPIINRSLTAITLVLSVTPILQALHDRSVLKVLPKDSFTLNGNGGRKMIEVHFSPKKRIPVFTEEIMMECAGMSQPLFIVTGSCQGIQITLGQTSVPFGAVVQGSQSQRRFTMQNSGDIGAGFKWEAEKFAPDFSISPVSGYISPSMEVSFTVTFHPRQLSPDIRYEAIKCQIEGDKPLSLTLTGMCVGAPPLKELISFNCHVRGRDVKNVAVANRSNQKWRLQPVIDGEYWSGPDAFTVEPQQSKLYEIVYRPLTMTLEGRKHQGTLFFALPDGTGLLYNLHGLSDPPKAISTISRDVPCKTSYVELLSITNWLRKPQRFKVTIEMMKPEKLDPGTTLKGLDYMDVAGSVKKDYRLNFFAHKEGAFSVKVMFRNERTGEYFFYFVNIRATPPGVVGTIELITPVRRTALHTLKVNNPLPYPVTFQTDCRVLDVNLPTQFTVPPNSEGTCMFEYQPLKVLDGVGKLTLTNNDLGCYTYDLLLKATPGGQEKTTYFKTTLGCNHVISIKFQNFARQKTDYTCKIDGSEWICEKSITAAPASSATGTEVTVDVTYEPVNLGQSQATLVLTSVIGGEYTFPLQGRCDPPKPQGPFVVKHKSTTSVSFRNIFPTTTQYFLQVDNPLFTVKASESIRAKKSHNITVMFDGASQPGSIITGKLTLTCIRPASGTTSWVFYLKGVTPEQTLL